MSAPITIATAATLAVSACAAAGPPQHGATPGYVCSNDGLDRFVGRQASQELGAEMVRTSGARTLRWVPPGTMVTMEFSPERLTVHLDEAGRVQSARCG